MCASTIIRCSTCRSKRFKAVRNLEKVQTPLHFLCLLKSKFIFSLSFWQFRYPSMSPELYICISWSPILSYSKGEPAMSYHKNILIFSWSQCKHRNSLSQKRELIMTMKLNLACKLENLHFFKIVSAAAVEHRNFHCFERGIRDFLFW